MPGRAYARCGLCSKRLPTETHDCRRRDGSFGHYSSINRRAFNVVRTGRTRDRRGYRRGRRLPAYEWRCQECGHTWWSVMR